MAGQVAVGRALASAYLGSLNLLREQTHSKGNQQVSTLCWQLDGSSVRRLSRPFMQMDTEQARRDRRNHTHAL